MPEDTLSLGADINTMQGTSALDPNMQMGLTQESIDVTNPTPLANGIKDPTFKDVVGYGMTQGYDPLKIAGALRNAYSDIEQEILQIPGKQESDRQQALTKLSTEFNDTLGKLGAWSAQESFNKNFTLDQQRLIASKADDAEAEASIPGYAEWKKNTGTFLKNDLFGRSAVRRGGTIQNQDGTNLADYDVIPDLLDNKAQVFVTIPQYEKQEVGFLEASNPVAVTMTEAVIPAVKGIFGMTSTPPKQVGKVTKRLEIPYPSQQEVDAEIAVAEKAILDADAQLKYQEDYANAQLAMGGETGVVMTSPASTLAAKQDAQNKLLKLRGPRGREALLDDRITAQMKTPELAALLPENMRNQIQSSFLSARAGLASAGDAIGLPWMKGEAQGALEVLDMQAEVPGMERTAFNDTAMGNIGLGVIEQLPQSAMMLGTSGLGAWGAAGRAIQMGVGFAPLIAGQENMAITSEIQTLKDRAQRASDQGDSALADSILSEAAKMEETRGQRIVTSLGIELGTEAMFPGEAIVGRALAGQKFTGSQLTKTIFGEAVEEMPAGVLSDTVAPMFGSADYNEPLSIENLVISPAVAAVSAAPTVAAAGIIKRDGSNKWEIRDQNIKKILEELGLPATFETKQQAERSAAGINREAFNASIDKALAHLPQEQRDASKEMAATMLLNAAQGDVALVDQFMGRIVFAEPEPAPRPNGPISRTGVVRAARARLSKLQSYEMGEFTLGKDGQPLQTTLGRRLTADEQSEMELLKQALENQDSPDHEKLAEAYGFELKKPITTEDNQSGPPIKEEGISLPLAITTIENTQDEEIKSVESNLETVINEADVNPNNSGGIFGESITGRGSLGEEMKQGARYGFEVISFVEAFNEWARRYAKAKTKQEEYALDAEAEERFGGVSGQAEYHWNNARREGRVWDYKLGKFVPNPETLPQPATQEEVAPTQEPVIQEVELDTIVPIPEDLERAKQDQAENNERWQQASASEEEILLLPIEDGKYQIVDGHHRYLRDLERGVKPKARILEAAPQANQQATFTTAKGSKYQLLEDGSTIRDKAARAEHPGESGVQPKSSFTIFVDDAGADALGIVQTEGVEFAIEKRPDGSYGAKATTGPGAGKFYRTSITKVSSKPEVGMIPVEVWNRSGKKQAVHFGNKITEVTLSNPAPPSQVTPAPERPAGKGLGALFPSMKLTPLKQADQAIATIDAGTLSEGAQRNRSMIEKAANQVASMQAAKVATPIQELVKPVQQQDADPLAPLRKEGRNLDKLPEATKQDLAAALQGDEAAFMRLGKVQRAMVRDAVPQGSEAAKKLGLRQQRSSNVTPKQDAEYLAAVEAGDMETAQRMVDQAAKKAGYDIGPMWRGEQSGERPDVYARNERREPGIFTTDEKAVADGYDSEGEARRFYLRGPVLDLRGDDQYQMSREGEKFVNQWAKDAEWDFVDRSSGEEVSPSDAVAGGELFDWEGDWSSERWKDLQATAFGAGFNTVILRDKSGDAETGYMDSYVAKDSNSIKSADPVTRDSSGNIIPLSQRFNESSNDIRFQKSQERDDMPSGSITPVAPIGQVETPEGPVFDAAKVLIDISRTGDATTLMHEMIHAMRFLSHDGRTLLERAMGTENFGNLMRWATKQGDLSPKDEETDERLAEGFEVWLATGVLPDDAAQPSALRRAFEALQKVIRDIVSSLIQADRFRFLKGEDTKLPADVAAAYQALLSRVSNEVTDSTLTPTEQQVRSAIIRGMRIRAIEDLRGLEGTPPVLMQTRAADVAPAMMSLASAEYYDLANQFPGQNIPFETWKDNFNASAKVADITIQDDRLMRRLFDEVKGVADTREQVIFGEDSAMVAELTTRELMPIIKADVLKQLKEFEKTGFDGVAIQKMRQKVEEATTPRQLKSALNGITRLAESIAGQQFVAATAKFKQLVAAFGDGRKASMADMKAIAAEYKATIENQLGGADSMIAKKLVQAGAAGLAYSIKKGRVSPDAVSAAVAAAISLQNAIKLQARRAFDKGTVEGANVRQAKAEAIVKLIKERAPEVSDRYTPSEVASLVDAVLKSKTDKQLQKAIERANKLFASAEQKQARRDARAAQARIKANINKGVFDVLTDSILAFATTNITDIPDFLLPGYVTLAQYLGQDAKLIRMNGVGNQVASWMNQFGTHQDTVVDETDPDLEDIKDDMRREQRAARDAEKRAALLQELPSILKAMDGNKFKEAQVQTLGKKRSFADAAYSQVWDKMYLWMVPQLDVATLDELFTTSELQTLANSAGNFNEGIAPPQLLRLAAKVQAADYFVRYLDPVMKRFVRKQLIISAPVDDPNSLIQESDQSWLTGNAMSAWLTNYFFPPSASGYEATLGLLKQRNEWGIDAAMSANGDFSRMVGDMLGKTQRLANEASEKQVTALREQLRKLEDESNINGKLLNAAEKRGLLNHASWGANPASGALIAAASKVVGYLNRPTRRLYMQHVMGFGAMQAQIEANAWGGNIVDDYAGNWTPQNITNPERLRMFELDREIARSILEVTGPNPTSEQIIKLAGNGKQIMDQWASTSDSLAPLVHYTNAYDEVKPLPFFAKYFPMIRLNYQQPDIIAEVHRQLTNPVGVMPSSRADSREARTTKYNTGDAFDLDFGNVAVNHIREVNADSNFTPLLKVMSDAWKKLSSISAAGATERGGVYGAMGSQIVTATREAVAMFAGSYYGAAVASDEARHDLAGYISQIPYLAALQTVTRAFTEQFAGMMGDAIVSPETIATYREAATKQQEVVALMRQLGAQSLRTAGSLQQEADFISGIDTSEGLIQTLKAAWDSPTPLAPGILGLRGSNPLARLFQAYSAWNVQNGEKSRAKGLWLYGFRKSFRAATGQDFDWNQIASYPQEVMQRASFDGDQFVAQRSIHPTKGGSASPDRLSQMAKGRTSSVHRVYDAMMYAFTSYAGQQREVFLQSLHDLASQRYAKFSRVEATQNIAAFLASSSMLSLSMQGVLLSLRAAMGDDEDAQRRDEFFGSLIGKRGASSFFREWGGLVARGTFAGMLGSKALWQRMLVASSLEYLNAQYGNKAGFYDGQYAPYEDRVLFEAPPDLVNALVSATNPERIAGARKGLGGINLTEMLLGIGGLLTQHGSQVWSAMSSEQRELNPEAAYGFLANEVIFTAFGFGLPMRDMDAFVGEAKKRGTVETVQRQSNLLRTKLSSKAEELAAAEYRNDQVAINAVQADKAKLLSAMQQNDAEAEQQLTGVKPPSGAIPEKWVQYWEVPLQEARALKEAEERYPWIADPLQKLSNYSNASNKNEGAINAKKLLDSLTPEQRTILLDEAVVLTKGGKIPSGDNTIKWSLDVLPLNGIESDWGDSFRKHAPGYWEMIYNMKGGDAYLAK